MFRIQSKIPRTKKIKNWMRKSNQLMSKTKMIRCLNYLMRILNAIIKMLRQAIIISLETNEKNGKSQQRSIK